jgi:hypothetical protein
VDRAGRFELQSQLSCAKIEKVDIREPNTSLEHLRWQACAELGLQHFTDLAIQKFLDLPIELQAAEEQFISAVTTFASTSIVPFCMTGQTSTAMWPAWDTRIVSPTTRSCHSTRKDDHSHQQHEPLLLRSSGVPLFAAHDR